VDEKDSVLIVDDDESICRSLRLIFEKKGYETETAGTGREVLEKARARFFNLALLDIKLPDVEGIELLAPLKEMHPDIALIVITGYASLESAVRALNEGASAYITKPLNMDEVLATVRGALEKQRLVMENRRLIQQAQRELAERKRADEALQESENRFRSIAETASDAIIIFDHHESIFFWNRAAKTIFGYLPGEALGKLLTSMISRRFHEVFRGEMKRVVSAGESDLIGKAVEVTGVRKDGSEFPLELSLATWRTREETFFTAIAHDITERKQAEEALKELLKKIERAKQEWESTADSLPDLVCLVDDGGRIIRANRIVETWNLGQVVDVKGRGVHELLHPGCVGSSCYLDSFWKEAWAEAMQGQPAQCEAYDEVLKRHVLVRIQPWKDWGKGTALGSTVVVVRDITEPKRAEERVQRLLDQQIAVNRLALALGESRDLDEIYYTIYVHVRALMDAEAFIISFYDHETQLCWAGYVVSEGTVRDAASLSPIPLQEVGHGTQVIHTGEPFYVPDLCKSMERTGTGYTILKDETVVEGPPPPEREDISGSALYVPMKIEGETIGVMQVQSYQLDAYSQEDIDLLSALANVAVIAIEKARLFEQVRAGRERLRRLTLQVVSAQEEERHRLSRELHDEAGQALTALKISLDLIQSDLPAEAGSLRQRLGEAVALTETTMDQIRLLAYGLRPPALDAVGLNYTLEGLCRDFAMRTQLSIDYAGAELPALSEAANICLYRFLQEALTNVAKHAYANQVWVALRYDAEMVSLAVEDDGQGFDKQAGTSAGIGLLGMQERIELLGGRLEIESWPGQGTRLTAHIPLQKAYLERRRAPDLRGPVRPRRSNHPEEESR
jgi:PAS domain S-box-containing protein